MKPLLVLKNLKRNKVKGTRAQNEKKIIRTAIKMPANCPRQQTQLLTNLMAEINQFLAVISNITSKKQTLRKEISCFVFYVLLTQNQLLKGVPYKQGKSL